ncbi:MAG: flagellar basal body P-ring formation chaperone FlgA [Methylococcaceae bacterium]
MFRLMLVFVSAFITTNAPHAEPQWQTHESIYDIVKSYVAQNINTTAAEYEITVLPLMNRLNLPLCSQPIEGFAPNLPKAGRMSISVRCNGAKKWAIFVSATITPFENVVILTQPLQHGDTVTNQAILARKDVSQLHNNYLTQLSQIMNKQVLRNLPVGTIVTAKDLVEPKLVKRGDRVLITSNQAGITIKMNGVAESDGSKGQTIRVKNQNSARIINAVIVEMGVVRVSQ